MGNENWDGINRRHEGWNQYEKLVLNHITESKAEIKDIKADVSNIQITLAGFKVELKQIISSSATRTSSYISLAISVISGVVLYFLIGKTDG